MEFNQLRGNLSGLAKTQKYRKNDGKKFELAKPINLYGTVCIYAVYSKINHDYSDTKCVIFSLKPPHFGVRTYTLYDVMLAMHNQICIVTIFVC